MPKTVAGKFMPALLHRTDEPGTTPRNPTQNKKGAAYVMLVEQIEQTIAIVDYAKRELVPSLPRNIAGKRLNLKVVLNVDAEYMLYDIRRPLVCSHFDSVSEYPRSRSEISRDSSNRGAERAMSCATARKRLKDSCQEQRAARFPALQKGLAG